uniref:Uncharacterized protein n=1 Tax=Parascaris univalens TaxID=6257 RepID=A0A915AI64_PARUN
MELRLTMYRLKFNVSINVSIVQRDCKDHQDLKGDLDLAECVALEDMPVCQEETDSPASLDKWDLWDLLDHQVWRGHQVKRERTQSMLLVGKVSKEYLENQALLAMKVREVILDHLAWLDHLVNVGRKEHLAETENWVHLVSLETKVSLVMTRNIAPVLKEMKKPSSPMDTKGVSKAHIFICPVAAYICPMFKFLRKHFDKETHNLCIYIWD